MIETLINTAFSVLEGLVHHNPRVQDWVMEKFDYLCEVKLSGRALAQMLHKVVDGF